MLYVLAFALGTWTNMKVLQTANVEEAFSLYLLFSSCPVNQECPRLPSFHILDP